MSLTAEELNELAELEDEHYLNSMGDHPVAMSADKLRRMIELKNRWRASGTTFIARPQSCGV